MGIGILQHINIRTGDLAGTVKFWEEAIGLKDGDRPNFQFPGAWLYSGDEAVMHLIDVSGWMKLRGPRQAVSIMLRSLLKALRP